ncbi:alpha/beta fold hydrolase [Roseiarcaceae bacterium H3SJ34-1]|uniref:alpha/beta hydrolase family protein n=1 Tax=Terripilifer ovatus TaxID=3032367 RepID=UPI003AB9ABDB|nr:alpha/beta fold hydrolase [Roseiarcaceae bacterium H3SJ34-1]
MQNGFNEQQGSTHAKLTRRGVLTTGSALVAVSYADAHLNPAAATGTQSSNQGKDTLVNKPINTAEYIPVDAPTLFMSVSPIAFPVPGRQTELQLKVTAPIAGRDLPILILSHGHGQSTYLSSLRGYNPLAEFYAAHGFVVIQPTHQDSKALGLDPEGPEGPLFWLSRAQDVHFVLDHLPQIEAAVPGLSGRTDRNRIVAVGHSMGGHTAGMLAGMRVVDPVDGKEWDLSDSRIKAGVLLAPPGNGSDLAPFASEHYKVLRNTVYSKMTAQALVVAGDLDQTDLFALRKDWRADAYTFSPGPKALLTMFGAKHALGGVSGYDVAESQDQDSERLGVVQRMTWAYLRSALYPADPAWRNASAALAGSPKPQGKVDTK